MQNNEVGDWENKWGREVKKQLPNIKNPLVVHGHNFVCVCVCVMCIFYVFWFFGHKACGT